MPTLFNQILGRLGFVKAAEVAKPVAWQQAEAQEASWDQPDMGVITNQADLYRVLSWVFAAIEAKANMAASVTLDIKRMEGEKTVDVPNHPFEALLRKPNPLQSRYAFWYDTYAYRSLTGNAYWWLNRSSENEPPSEMWLIPSDRIRPVPDEKLYLRGYMYKPSGGAGEIPLELWEVCHFKRWNPRSRFIGMSEIESVALASQGDIAAQKWNTNYFGKDNAKIPGILAFHDPVGDVEWTRIKHEINTQYTGVNRRLMMLRGVGKNIEFMPNSISQKDMEFLGGRQFTKEEIWTVLAPGLASMLAVNATEANANAGERTFRSLAVWPLLTAIAEQVTLDILPAYGENQLAEFEDIRITDKNLELQERQSYERVHTVDEVREKYDEDKPLEDKELGAMLVTVANTKSANPAPVVQNNVQPNEQPKPGDEQQPPDKEQTQPEGEKPPEQSADQLPPQAKADLNRWQRKAIKSLARAGKAQVAFESAVIPQTVKDSVVIELENALSEDDIKEVFAEATQTAVKSGPVRRTAAGLLDPNGEAKDAAEARIMRLMKVRLNAQLADVLDLLGDPPDFSKLTDEWWNTQAGKMIAAVRPEIERMMHVAADTMIDAGIGVDWSLVAVRAAEFASNYSFGLIKDITDQTRKILQNAINDFVRTPGMTRADLEAQIAPWFGEARASRIAVTETTRAFMEGEKAVAKEAQDLGLKLLPVWHTRNDELVCPICGALDGKSENLPGRPHPNCILPGNKVLVPSSLVAGAKSFYVGGAVEIETSSGRILTVTANHPVLTLNGWVAAKFISESDYVMSALDGQRIAAAINPDNNNTPAAIEQVFDSLVKSSGVSSARVPVAAEDFHGDGRFIYGNIDIVYADSLLLGDGKPSSFKPVREHKLSGNGLFEGTLIVNGALDFSLDGVSPASPGNLRRCNHCGAHFWAGLTPTNEHAIGNVTWGNSSLDYATAESPAIDTRLAREFLFRFPSLIAPEQIVKIRHFDTSSHVYDLQDKMYELYICNGIVVKNCRCWITHEWIVESK